MTSTREDRGRIRGAYGTRNRMHCSMYGGMHNRLRNRTLAMASLLLSVSASASAQKALIATPLSTFGAEVRLDVKQAGTASEVKGELLSVDSTSVWVHTNGRATIIPRDSVVGVRVRVHRIGRKTAWIAGGIVGVAATAGMTGACSSIEDTDCGGVALGVGLASLVATAISGELMERNTWQRLPVGRWARLAPYARFPQGVPPTMAGESYRFTRDR